MSRNKPNWMKDRPNLRTSWAYIKNVRENLKGWSNHKLHTKAKQLKKALIEEARLDITDQILITALYDGVSIFIRDIWVKYYIRHRESEPKRNDLILSKSNLTPPGEHHFHPNRIFVDLTFIEIISILVLDAAFNDRELEAATGAAFLFSWQLKEQKIKQELSNDLRNEMKIEPLRKSALEKQAFTDSRNSSIRKIAESIINDKSKWKHIKTKSDAARKILNIYPELACKLLKDAERLKFLSEPQEKKQTIEKEKIKLLSEDAICKIIRSDS